MKRIILLLFTAVFLLASCTNTPVPPGTESPDGSGADRLPASANADNTQTVPQQATDIVNDPGTDGAASGGDHPAATKTPTEGDGTTDAITESQTEPSVNPETQQLPVIYITTDKGESITSKEEYIHAVMKIGSDEYGIQIRGRGNASWNDFPKKGYRVKLDEKAKLLGMKNDRDWVLVSSYPDKTLIRNSVAHAMAAQLDGLEFTPVHVLAELYLNGEYRGVYTLAEKIEFGGGKLDYESGTADDTSYLFEVGWDYNDEMVYGMNYFDTKYIQRIVIKEPEITKKYSSQVKYAMNYLKQAENAIISRNGYDKYIDVDSFIDFLIIIELTNNTESVFYRSCYFYKPAGGLLYMGPVWDFDMAFGNLKSDIKNYDGWAAAEATSQYVGVDGVNWYTFLMKDPNFTSRLAERWDEVKNRLLSTAINTIDDSVSLLGDGVQRNFEKWDIIDKAIGMGNVNPRIYNTYELQIKYLRDFITTRYKWIDEAMAEFRIK